MAEGEDTAWSQESSTTRFEKQALNKLGRASAGFKQYTTWLRRAHQIREIQNIVMYSRWGIEPYGRHATAISTPVFVEPAKEVIFTTGQLLQLRQACDTLGSQLSRLRGKHPL